MSMKTVSKLTSVLGLWSSLLVFILVGMNIVTGVSQEYFESMHPAREYTERIIRDAGPLNAAFTVDNLFVVSYAAFFVGLGVLDLVGAAVLWTLVREPEAETPAADITAGPT